MKKSTFLAIFGLIAFSLVFSPKLFAQTARFGDNPQPKQITPRTNGNSGDKCGTMEWLDAAFRAFPAYRLQYAENERRLAEVINNRIKEQQGTNPSYRIQTVTIPIVFHVVMNAAGQTAITDAKILAQLDTFNHDFAGLNGDSTNIPPEFQAVRGHVNIQFCLAQRTPNDLPSTGIDRVTSNVVSNGSVTNDPIKSTAAGGADAWDPTRFFNVWLGNFSSPTALGYATFPIGTAEGTGIPLNQQGVVVLAQSIPGGTAAPYNKGRTLTHEAGHYFWLRHINGDATCGDDFPGTPGIDDTPLQASLTGGCPSGAVASGCAGSPNPPGKMYQNFMDYTDDACMTMFTIGQGIRANTALNMYRASLLTSNGCTPPPAAAGNDAAISAILNPATGSTLGCTAVTPVVTLINLGSNTLTSATINVRLNGTLAFSQPWTGSLAQGGTANLTLNTLNIATIGTNTIKIHTTLPNGAVDAVPANDTSTSVVTRIAPSALPVSNGFETSLTPTGWSVTNPDGDGLNWFRFNPTGGSAGGSVWAAVIDNYDFDVAGTVDDIVTPVINTSALLANDSLLITFDLAHKNFPLAGFEDSLKVLVTGNCGATWTTVWAKGDPDLATAGSTTGLYNPPAAADWKNQKIAIGNNLFGGGAVQVAIRNVNGFGNVTWVDNINIIMKPRKDMQTTAIVRPNVTECAPPFAPSITVRNNGGELVTGFKTGYILDNAAPVIQAQNIPLNTGQSATVTFPNLSPAAGVHTIKMFVADPITTSVGPDGTPGNDTLTRTFTVPVTAINIVEGFEGAAFLPANWVLINANNNITWTKANPAVGRNSANSAFIDNWSTNTAGQLDIMQAPPVNTTGADSVIITFDVAHRPYPGALDRLRVLASTNCGTSFTSVYSKSGTTLGTGPSMEDDYRNPTASEWRTETIRLNNTFTGGNILIQFEDRSDWGNNIFIDNINIAPKFKRDIELLSVSPDIACVSGYTPTATIRNRGTEAITGFSISYAIGSGAAVTQNVTGLNVPSNGTTTVTLAAGTLVPGANTIKVYTFNPVTASGTGDQYLVNDTIAKTIYAASTITAPSSVVETFEGSFIPSGWAISNPDNAMTWQKAGIGKSSTGSAYLRNYTYYSAGQKDGLYTPVLAYTGVDSVMLSFDLSAATKDYPGATTSGLDTLEVLVTRDCGNTFTSVYKKWGSQLQTINDPNYPQLTEFTPNGPLYWRRETVNLSSFAPAGPLQVVFRNTTNTQNNIYIDNVNFRTTTLPPRLKTDGVIVTPNPFSEQFNLWFVAAPSDLRYITVMNAAGQLVWNKTYSNGSTSNVININMSGMAAGVYVIHLGYSSKGDDKKIRIIKSN